MKKLVILVCILSYFSCTFAQIAKVYVDDSVIYVEDKMLVSHKVGDTLRLSNTLGVWKIIPSGTTCGVIQKIAFPNQNGNAKVFAIRPEAPKKVEDYAIALFAEGDTIKITKTKEIGTSNEYGWKVYFGNLPEGSFSGSMIFKAIIMRKDT